jgi:hypothetical protein
MHVHGSLDRAFTLPFMVANGVTGIREMFGRRLEAILELRREIEAGQLIGPAIVTAGRIVDGPGAFWPGSIVVRTDSAARAAVGEQQARGADFVKVYSALPRAAYFGLADEARKRGIPFVGHVPDLITLEEASLAGQASVEHLSGLLAVGADSAHRAAMVAELEDSAASPRGRPALRAALDRQRRTLAASFDQASGESVFALLARNRTWQVPTLTVAQVGADPLDPALDAVPEMRYVPHILKGMWHLVRRFAGSDTSSERRALNRRVFEIQRWSVGAMKRAGVSILAGTDTPNAFVVPGSSLHHELELLVESGLTPLEALRAATIEPARFLGALDSLGTVEPGKVANLVLLDANPLSDIRNSRTIRAVVVRGRLLDRPLLDSVLARVEGSRWHLNDAGLTLVEAMLVMVPAPVRFGLPALLISLVLVIMVRRRRRKQEKAA